MQKHFLTVLYPLSRPAVKHEVELPGIVDDLKVQLLNHKVSASFVGIWNGLKGLEASGARFPCLT